MSKKSPLAEGIQISMDDIKNMLSQSYTNIVAKVEISKKFWLFFYFIPKNEIR